MITLLTCPQGHQWQPAMDGNAQTTDLRIPCPECGSLVLLVSSQDRPAAVGGETRSFSAPLGRRQDESATAPHHEVSRPVIPGYEILGELGRGGMGVVYKARQVRLNRVVALKMILAGAHAGEKEQGRFRSEAEAVARLQHPNIVQIHEIGDVDGLPFFSLEYLEGGSLAQKLNGTPLPSRQSAQLIETLARAIDAAHQCGIIHRDLKPANILLEPVVHGPSSVAKHTEAHSSSYGQPKITDFGLAKRLDTVVGQTQSGAIMGTPSYMAPEQASGKSKEIGPAADVYALGAILYETLTGRPPFRAETPVDTILQVISDEPVPPTRLRPRIPRDLETICLKCLHKDPRKRYSTAQALAEDLHCFLHDEPIQARPVSWPGRLWRWAKRNPGVARLTAALAFFLITVTAGAVFAAFRFNRVAEDAKKARKDAEVLAEQNRQKVYAARIKVAHQAWEMGDAGRTVELLKSLLPEGDQEDLRGFEWYYLWNLCHSDRLTLVGHDGPVRCVAYAPNSKTLASGGNDNLVKLWDAGTGEEQKTLTGHTDWVTALTFSPDGQWLATGSADRTVILWNRITGKTWKSLQGHELPVSSLAFSPDGKTLASSGGEVVPSSFSPLSRFGGSKYGEIKLWDVATGTPKAALRGHRAGVLSVVFAPDGQTLASASFDHTVKLWDMKTLKERTTLVGHEFPIFAVTFASHGKLIATAGYDQTAMLWNAATGERLEVFQGHKGPVFAVAFTPNGRRLVSAGADQTARLWDLASGLEQASIKGHTGYIWSVAFSPDGKTLATSSSDGTVKLWDTNFRQEVDFLQTNASAAEFAPDSKSLVASDYGRTVKQWDVATGHGTAILAKHAENVESIAYSPDGQTIASGDGKGTVKLWDVATGKERAILKGHEFRIWSLSFSPDGQTLASGCLDGTVTIWDLATGRDRATLKLGNEIRWVAFARDGKTLAVVCHLGQHQSVLRLLDGATWIERSKLEGHTDFIEWVAYSPDGKTFATGSWDRSVKLWDANTEQELATLKGHMDVVFHGVFSPDGKTLATASWDGTVKLWHLATREELLTLQGPAGENLHVAFAPNGRTLAAVHGSSKRSAQRILLWRTEPAAQPQPTEVLATPSQAGPFRKMDQVWSLAFSKDGKWLASGSEDGTARLWNWAAMDPKSQGVIFKGHAGRVRSVALSPDDRILATASLDGTVKLWDAANGEELATLTGHSELVNCVAFSPNGETLASCSLDGTARMWETLRGRELATCTGHEGWVLSVAFAPDGKTLASTGRDRTVRLWDVTSHKEIACLRGHSDGVETAVFSPDGRSLISGGWDGQVIVWDILSGKIRSRLAGMHKVNCLALALDGKTLAVGDASQIGYLWNLETGQRLGTFRVRGTSLWGLAFSPDGKTLASGTVLFPQDVRYRALQGASEIVMAADNPFQPASFRALLSLGMLPDPVRHWPPDEDSIKLWKVTEIKESKSEEPPR